MRERVKLIILIGGEHILGDVLTECSDCDGGVQVQNPVSIVPHPDPTQGGKLVFMPYLQLSEDKVCTFKNDHIRHILVPKAAMVNDWDRQFGSGLIVPQQNIILE